MRFGWNTTCYQLLNPGMRLWFAAAGDAVIGYVTHAGVRIVAGAPVTPHARFVAVAAEFEAEARAAGESVCFFAAEEWFEERWQAHSPRARVVLGAQPVWEPAHWSRVLAGNASLRAQLNRARNKGVQVRPVAPADAERSGELRDVLAEWLAGRGLPPLHFLVESALLDGLGDRRVFLAEVPAGLQGFLLASPVPARSGWLAELVVRRPTAPNGTAELLISTAVQQLAAGARAAFLPLPGTRVFQGQVRTRSLETRLRAAAGTDGVSPAALCHRRGIRGRTAAGHDHARTRGSRRNGSAQARQAAPSVRPDPSGKNLASSIPYLLRYPVRHPFP